MLQYSRGLTTSSRRTNLNYYCITALRNLHFTIDSPHLIDSFYLRGESAVDTEDVPADESTQWQIIEGIIEILPWSGASIFLNYFVVETVDCGDLPGFVVAPEEDNLLWVFDFVAE